MKVVWVLVLVMGEGEKIFDNKIGTMNELRF